MVLWDQFIEVIRVAIFAASLACGGNVGSGIVAVTLFVRLLMFPLTLRLARISAAHYEIMRRLRPELDKLRAKFKNQPKRLAEETNRLFKRKGVSPSPLLSVLARSW